MFVTSCIFDFRNLFKNKIQILLVYLVLLGGLLTGCGSLNFFENQKVKTSTRLDLKIAQNLNPMGLDKFRRIVRAQPVLYKDYVLVADPNIGLHAFYIGSDQNLKATQFYKAWTFPLLNGVESSFAVINNRAFVGASDGNFYSIDLDKKEVVWKFPLKAEVLSEPVLDDDGHVYFLSGNNIFYCLDAADGRQIWAYSRQDTANMTVRGGASATFDKDRLYVGFSDGSLVALSISSGAPLWEIQLNKNKRFRDIDAKVQVDEKSIYVSAYDDKVYSLNKSDGSIQWRYEAGGYSNLTLEGEFIYVPLSSNQLVKLNKESGKEVWKISDLKGVPTEVLIKGDFVIFGDSKGDLRIHNKQSGLTVHQFEPGRGVFSKPLVDKKNNIYFVSNESIFYGLSFTEEINHYYKSAFH